MYSVSLKIGDQVLKGEGETAEEAVSKLPTTRLVTTKAIVTFEKDGKKKDILLMPRQIKRLGMKISRVFVSKQFDYGLK